VADLVDNSIEAGATVIRIRMEFNGDHSWLQIADNGKGMTKDELNEAMRFGTERNYGPNELGKFGLGMKTASISQCRRLTVASRDANSDSIVIRQLNLDRIEETNRWEIIELSQHNYSNTLWESLQDQHGTVVQWENMDRMLQYDPPDGMRAIKGFNRLTRELEEHLSMVFHRFLSGELENRRKLEIRINNNVIEPWDPFARNEQYTKKLEQKTLAIIGSGGMFSVICSPYILPPKEKFSSLEAFRKSSGPSKWNSQQGFYIYRHNRMIQAGGWSRMRTTDEHTKLARIALDLDSSADSSLGLNIMKTSMTFPDTMKNALTPIVESVVKLARKEYTPEVKTSSKSRGALKSASAVAASISQSPSTASHVKAKALETQWKNSDNFTGNFTNSSSDNTKTISPPEIALALERAAERVRENAALEKIRRAMKAENPSVASSMGW
ncbi:MAG: ATP-binding protein, partial [Thermoplasmatales archaeon]